MCRFEPRRTLRRSEAPASELGSSTDGPRPTERLRQLHVGPTDRLCLVEPRIETPRGVIMHLGRFSFAATRNVPQVPLIACVATAIIPVRDRWALPHPGASIPPAVDWHPSDTPTPSSCSMLPYPPSGTLAHPGAFSGVRPATYPGGGNSLQKKRASFPRGFSGDVDGPRGASGVKRASWRDVGAP